MPLYQYEVINTDGSSGEQFEVFQSMADQPLTVHPETGQPVRRVFGAPAIGGKWSDSAMGKSVADDKKLERLGPFATPEEAQKAWAGRAWATVDDAMCRYRIEIEQLAPGEQ